MKRTLSLAAAALAALTTLSACAPLVVGGAAVGSMLLFTDRRTSGAQLEDQAIELKARNRVRDVLGERGHVNATSYNRTVLLTGEVDNEEDARAVQQAIERIENVRGTVNELAATIPSSLSQRSNDVILSSKVKASFVDTKSLQANAFKVVTERGIVYLMGRVTEREAEMATEVARGVAGVQKVVRVFEVVSESELNAGRAPS
jgi:osmotically-inducible protein OsmY